MPDNMKLSFQAGIQKRKPLSDIGKQPQKYMKFIRIINRKSSHSYTEKVSIRVNRIELNLT
jgi:hypothetical protein